MPAINSKGLLATSGVPAGSPAGSGRRQASGLALVLLGVISGLLCGCEQPLSMTSVETNAAKPIHRTDEFQSAAASGQTIVVVGNHGLILVSRDEGSRWQRNTLPDWPSLISVAACGRRAFAAISYEGALWLSVDDGATWRSKALGNPSRPQAINCDSAGGMWVVGESASLLHSSDRGEHWQSTMLEPQDLFLTTIQFIDATHGYVLGEFGTVLQTVDAGATWQKLPPMPGGLYPEAAFFSDVNHGWVVGLNGTILETMDGAQHWRAADVKVVSPLYGIAQVADVMYIVGGDGAILRRTDLTWTALAGPRLTHSFLRVVVPLGPRYFVVAGGGGSLARLEHHQDPIQTVSNAASPQ